MNTTVLRAQGARSVLPGRFSFWIMVSVLSLSFLTGTFSSRYSEGITAATVASQVLGKVNGTNAYNHDLEMEGIAETHSLSNYAFRSAGSRGGNATADWIASQFQSFGLETYEESFQFTNWDVLSKPSLIIDDDGNPSTVGDQILIEPFQCEHYSWPTPPSGEFADLAILPLPHAAGGAGCAPTVGNVLRRVLQPAPILPPELYVVRDWTRLRG